MDEAGARNLILDHYAAAGHDEDHVAAIYTDDAVLDFPQGRERIRGRPNILAFRTAYPVRVTIQIERTKGHGDFWVNEGTIEYDGAAPQRLVSIWEFRGDKVVHETVYVAEPWEPPAGRARWVEAMPYDRATGSPS